MPASTDEAALRVLLASCGAAHLPNTAAVLAERGLLGGLWMADKLRNERLRPFYRRCWPYHLGIKPFLHCPWIGVRDRWIPSFVPLWDRWVRRQELEPRPHVVMGIMAYCAEPFALAEKWGALKVVDASSSHPTSFYGFWQRECDIWSPGFEVTLPRSIFRRCARDAERADLILCPSTFVRDSMLYNGIPAHKLAVNPYGTNVSIFTPRTALPPCPRFIAVGTLTLRKGYQYLFEAMRLIKQSRPDAELLAIGPIHDDFKRVIARWNGLFEHRESVDHSTLSQLLRESTAFVFPSCEEGFARVITEAMACGLPIIATHESGATTAVRHEEEGLIVPGRDPRALAEAMLRIADSPALAWQLGDKAAQWSLANGSWEHYGDRLAGILCDALRKRNAP